MAEKDQGNVTTQTIYQLATEPIFASDLDLGREEENISWEVSGVPDESINPDEAIVKDKSIQNPESDNGEVREEEKIKDESPPADGDEEKEKAKKKNRTSEKKRIADLTRQLKQAQSVAHDVLTRNQYLETKLTEKQKEALAQEENLITSQKERIKKYLADALEEGDSEKIADAHDLLSQYNAELRLINSRKNSPQTEQQYAPPPPQQPYYIEQDQVDHEIGAEWLDNNPWANPHSPDFDPELHQEADNYSIKLAKKYTLSGKKSEIGSAEFFDEISNYMQSCYEIEPSSQIEKPQSKGRIQMKTETSSRVAPVTRNINAGESTTRKADIVLTPEQREMAHTLRGFITDPRTGQKITDNKILEEIYKRNLMRR